LRRYRTGQRSECILLFGRHPDIAGSRQSVVDVGKTEKHNDSDIVGVSKPD